MLKMTIMGLKGLDKVLRARMDQERKALNTAVRVEGFRLRKQLVREIRQGRPGGRTFAPRTYLSKAYSGRPAQPALARLALGIRYFLPRRDPIEMHIGWTGPQVSKSWKRLAVRHQTGFIEPVDPARRRYLIKVIAQKSPRSDYRRYIPRESTTHFKTPARPIIAPFWQAHKAEAERNIRANYRRKLKGERI